MTNKHRLGWLFKDDETRLVILDVKLFATSFLANLLTSYTVNPPSDSNAFFAASKKIKNPFVENGDSSIMSQVVSELVDVFLIGLGVTKIKSSQEYSMPLSKGVGSTGEIIHLMGAKNEIIKLEFTTDRYPGRLGYIIRYFLQTILENSKEVYLIDDMFIATPCLIRKTELTKQGEYRGAIMGELELISLATGGLSISERISKVSTLAKKLKNSLAANSRVNNAIATSFVGSGSHIVFTSLLESILGV